MKKRKTSPKGARPQAPRKASSRSRATRKAAPTESPVRSHRSKPPKNTALLREQADPLQLTHDTLCVIVRNLDEAITFWNRGAEEQYGWTESEVLGQLTHVLLQTQFPQPLEEINAMLLRSGRWEGELLHVTRDGKHITVASHWALQRDAQGNPSAILEVNNDITERKRAEDQLFQLNAELERRMGDRTSKLEAANAQLEELNTQLEEEIAERQAEIRARVQADERARHLASFPELNPNPVIEVDASGKITFSNPATQKVLQKLGVDPGNVDTLLPTDMDDILTVWDKKTTASYYREIVVNDKVFGETITLIPQFEVAHVYAFDITERKRAEDEIRRLNEALQQRTQDLENANEELEVSNQELRVANEDMERQIAVRERVEQALRRSESRYHSLFENMLDGFAYCQLLYDDHGHPVDFVYLDVNGAFETLTGLKDVVGKKVTEVIPRIKEEHPELFETYGRVAQTGEPERFVLEFKPLAIRLSLSVYSPERGYFVAVFENITERERAEELSRALNALNGVIHSTLDLDEIMQRAMREAAQALGCETAAISLRQADHWLVRYVHNFPKEVIGAQMNDDQERHAVLAIQTKKPVAVEDAFDDERVNREHMRKWGVRSVLVVPLIVKDQAIGVIFFNYQQSTFTFRGYHIDFGTKLAASLSLALENARLFENLEQELAQRKLAEARIQKLNEDLEQRAGDLEVANEELERLATSLALDLRSPLVSLDSVSRVIAQDYGAQLPPQARQLFQLIQGNAEEMDQLTQGLLRLMRLARQTLRKQELNPEEFVHAALADLAPERAGRQVEITVDPLPTCRADPLLFKQVWVNLLSNALRFTRTREQARIEIGARREGNRVVYFVKDNGVGFDMSYAGTIFRAFQRYHHVEEWGGTGLGLAIVESIIRRHGGRVWAEGELGRGATFYFTLGA